MSTVTSLGFSIFTTYKGGGAKKAASDLDRVANTAKDVGKAVVAGMGAAAAAVTALGAASFKAGVESNALQQRTNMALETLLGTTHAAQQQMDKLREFGSTSPIALPVWIRAQQQMIAFGVEIEKVIPMLGAIQDAVVAAGGTEEEIRGVVRALSQMASKGKLSAEELNQMGERGVDAAGIVALAMDTTAGEIRDSITKGTLTVNEFFDGFIAGSNIAFDGAAEGLRKTFTGTLDMLSGVQRRIGEIFATPFVDPDGGGAFVVIGNAIVDMLRNFEAAARPLAPLMKDSISPSVNRAADAIRRFGEGITTEKLLEFVSVVQGAVPVIVAVGTALTTRFAAGLIAALPGMAAFGAALNPIAAGLVALIVASPELRSAVTDLVIGFSPLVPVITNVALLVAKVLTGAIHVISPILSAVAAIVGVLADNLWLLPVAFVAVNAAILAMGVSMGLAAPGVSFLVASVYGLTGAMTALRTAMMAHPILLIAGLVSALVAFAIATDDAEKSTAELANTIKTDLASAAAGADVHLGDIGNKFKELYNEIQPKELSWHGLNNTFDELSRVVDGMVMPSPEAFGEWVSAVKSLDDYLAGLIEKGWTTDEVYRHVREELGLSAEQYEEILPLLFGYQNAQDEVNRTQEEFVKEVGRSVAALAGLADAMKNQFNPIADLRDAQLAFADAQEVWNEAVKEHGKDSKEAADAAMDLAAAGIDVVGATEAAGGALGEGLSPALQQMLSDLGVGADALDMINDIMLETGEQGQQLADDITDLSLESQAALGVMGVKAKLEMQGMSSEAAFWAASTKNAVDTLIAEGWSYADAIREVARRSGRSTESIEQGFIDARERGMEFSDDYPATVTLRRDQDVINRIKAVKNMIASVDRTIKIAFQYTSSGNWRNYLPKGGTFVPYADGGPVVGPGTGTSDSIAAALSNGEFVITAQRVRALGGFSGTENLLRAFTGYAKGGPVTQSPSPAAFSRGGPVRVAPATQSAPAITVVINGPVASERQAEDLIVKAYESAVRKRRIRG